MAKPTKPREIKRKQRGHRRKTHERGPARPAENHSRERRPACQTGNIRRRRMHKNNDAIAKAGKAMPPKSGRKASSAEIERKIGLGRRCQRAKSRSPWLDPRHRPPPPALAAGIRADLPRSWHRLKWACADDSMTCSWYCCSAIPPAVIIWGGVVYGLPCSNPHRPYEHLFC